MGQIILCETKEAENTYQFQSFHQEISTYEELCYYIRKYFIFFVEEGIPDNLVTWISDELGIRDLEQEWDRLPTGKEKLKRIITCRNYFLPQEVSVLMKKYDRYDKMTEVDRKNRLADEYLKQHRYERALHYYRRAYQMKKNEKCCYNMAVCYAHQWDFEHAAKYFYESYEISGRKRILNAYYSILMLQGEFASVKIMAGDDYSTFMRKWNGWKQEWEEQQKDEGMIQNNQQKKKRLEQWKRDYRKEVE